MKKILVGIILSGWAFTASAQFSKPIIAAQGHLIKEMSGLTSRPVASEFIGFRNPPSESLIFQPVLSKVSDNDGENEALLQKIKEEKARLRQSGAFVPDKLEAKTNAVPPSPVVSTNFAGLTNGGQYTPLDNTIAISDKDTIVVMINSRIGYCNDTGDIFYNNSIYNLVNDHSLSNTLCDPKVIWDNTARRFIFYSQVCETPPVSADSKIILGFSKTSNPADGWYVYKFPGDALASGDWWDYPKLAVSSDEVFVTGNLFNGTTFHESVILQIQKAPCYAGGSTLSSIWSGLTGAFTIMPLGYGQSGSYGPGILALSFTGNDLISGHLNLYDITNNIASGTAVINTYDIPVPAYSAPGNATQTGYPLPLNTGDNRVQDGFYLHGNIHVVHNVDGGSGYSGFRYYRINVNSLSPTEYTFANAPVSDYSYPAIASASADSTDNSVVVAFNECSPAFYPRTCVVACDQSGAFSAPVVVRAGDGYVHYAFNTMPYERWGDYTGLCRKAGDPGHALWMAGMYGSAAPSNNWLQWIAKINPKNVGLGNVAVQPAAASVYPNPVTDRYAVTFYIPERQHLVINITDVNGRTVTELYNGMAESGDNNFSFNKGGLVNGIYSLNIIGAKTNIRNEKIVISGK